jgi:hypothetical protein
VPALLKQNDNHPAGGKQQCYNSGQIFWSLVPIHPDKRFVIKKTKTIANLTK